MIAAAYVAWARIVYIRHYGQSGRSWERASIAEYSSMWRELADHAREEGWGGDWRDDYEPLPWRDPVSGQLNVWLKKEKPKSRFLPRVHKPRRKSSIPPSSLDG